MAKIVYNACFGGFGLSREAVLRYAEIKGVTVYHRPDGFGMSHYYLCPQEEYERLRKEEEESTTTGWRRYARSNALYFSPSDIARNDPALVQVVEELDDKASGSYSKLRIKELEAGTMYRIDEYDGSETVVTRDADEWSVA
jgi:hypothetical protein